MTTTGVTTMQRMAALRTRPDYWRWELTRFPWLMAVLDSAVGKEQP